MIDGRFKYAISGKEMEIADKSVEMALKAGASDVQVSLDKAQTELIAHLDGELDNVRRTGDRALTFKLYVDGRYGVFSTNRLDADSLGKVLEQAVENVRMLAPDPFRKLPDTADTAKDAVNGDEMGLCWDGYDGVSQEMKLGIAGKTSVFKDAAGGNIPEEFGNSPGWKLVSEETEYNNTFTDTYLTDSNGTRCRQAETSFEICSQCTVEDESGNKFSGMWWDYDIRPSFPDPKECGWKAVEKAVAQLNPVRQKGGRHTMVVDRLVNGKLLSPVIKALGGRAIQQKSSFLTGSLDTKVFGEGLTIVDRPREKGKCGSILFEQDGRACLDRDIIIDGVVKEYFISTYMSGKMNMPATSETANRAVLLPYAEGDPALTRKLREGEGSLELDGILGICGDGILVTGFNGGNCNSATGDFSYGIEGFRFSDGHILCPVENMVITGNMINLWNSLIVAGTDPVNGFSRQIPTLAFRDVSFSA